jgi:hypothetical protein
MRNPALGRKPGAFFGRSVRFITVELNAAGHTTDQWSRSPAMSKLAAIHTTMSAQAFAVGPDSRLAYVKEVRSEDVAVLYPQAPLLEPGQRIFALHLADGTPILLAESRETAVEDARNHQLDTVSVH